MIKKFYSRRKEMPGWKRDPETGQLWSWGYDIRLRNPKRRARESGFATRGDAEAAVGRIRQLEKESKHGFISAASAPTFDELVKRRLASIHNPRERARSTRILGDLAKVLPARIKVTELSSEHLQLFVERRLSDGLKSQSVNRELNSVMAALNSARKLFGRLAQWTPPAAPRPKQSKAARERVITQAEKDKLLGYLLAPRRDGERESDARARRDAGLIIHVALLTGLRHGEINRLMWHDLDGTRSLKVVGTKTATVSNPTRYITPLTPTMLAILDERRRRSSTPYIFTRSGGALPRFYQILRKACEVCGIPYGRDAAGGLVMHDARHTATTRLLQAGVDVATVQSVTGHSDKTMVLYYAHATTSSRERAAAALEAYAGNPGPAEPQEEDVPEYVN